jgi:hypothetical protein
MRDTLTCVTPSFWGEFDLGDAQRLAHLGYRRG